MGILNVTPDSFYDGGRFDESLQAQVDQVGKMLTEGAKIIDIGGQSTRPGSVDVGFSEERDRVVRSLSVLAKAVPEAKFSIDTYRAKVAEEAIRAGATMINDVSGGRYDEAMFDTVARLQVPYVVMHVQGTPATMQQSPTYSDVVAEVYADLANAITRLRDSNVNDIIIDPGFGFGKKDDHNFTLLSRLQDFRFLKRPILVGLSRKSMICRTLNVTPSHALNGTTALNMTALLKGASILRVHDVSAAVEVVRLFESVSKNDIYALPEVPFA